MLMKVVLIIVFGVSDFYLKAMTPAIMQAFFYEKRY